jgi:serine/threonine protein phosphatase 1
MRTFCLGDIHGGYLALVQVLERSGFNYDNDRLIFLGDVTDGWSETFECINELLKIKNLIHILGNHDQWTLAWMNSQLRYGYSGEGSAWISQGGKETIESYVKHGILLSENDKDIVYINDDFVKHKKFLESAKLYHIENNKLFVHAGFDWKKPIEESTSHDLLWSRKFYETSFIYNSQKNKFKDYEEIYIGHTPTIVKKTDQPLFVSNVVHLDTGAAYTGRLTIMNIDTKEYFQSDTLPELYPNEKGRNK